MDRLFSVSGISPDMQLGTTSLSLTDLGKSGKLRKINRVYKGCRFNIKLLDTHPVRITKKELEYLETGIVEFE